MKSIMIITTIGFLSFAAFGETKTDSAIIIPSAATTVQSQQAPVQTAAQSLTKTTRINTKTNWSKIKDLFL